MAYAGYPSDTLGLFEEHYRTYVTHLSPEKVYLHTDREQYNVTDTIWFAGYIENASYMSEYPESNYIYVELIATQMYRDIYSLSRYAVKKPEVVVRKKIKRTGNSFSGYIPVPEGLSTERCILRAYSYWMLNRPVEYMYSKSLRITNPMKDDLMKRLSKEKIRDKDLYLQLNADYNEPEKETRTRYDVQFLPEGGRYLPGVGSAVWIKSIGSDGLGVSVYGYVSTRSGDTLARFKTDRRGIGKIIITGELGERYHATVMDSTGYIDRLEFPGPEDRGVMIHARYDVHGEKNYETSDVINIRVTADTASISRSLRLYIHNKSEIYHSQAISDTVSYCVLRMSPLTPGIHSAVVADTSGHVYSERVFMVFPTGAGLSVSTDKSSYGKRDKVTCVVSLPGGEDFENGSYSVSVTDKELIPYEGKEDIRSYLYLRSELQGYIENPGYYFDTTRSLRARTESVDSLLQTQGWRYYDLPAISAGQIPRPYFGREYRQTLFGKVSGLFRTARHVTVSFLAPSIQFAAMGQVDSGYFVLKDIDFPEGTSFIVSAVGKDGRSRRYAPILQEDYFAPLYEYPAEREPVIYGNDYKEVSVKRYYDSDNCQMMFDIKPIIVKANRLSIIPKNSPSIIPNYPLRKEWYRDTFHIKPYAKSYDIKSFAAATYPGVRYEVGGYITGPYVSAASGMSRGTRRIGVVCYLNGLYVPQYELDGIPLEDVESMAYISGLSAAPFQRGVEFSMYPKPVLMIRTKPSYRNISPSNVTAGTPLGWQKPVRFYSPKYDAESSQGAGKKRTDNRLTVYWNPNLVFDSDGKSEFSFYTTDSGNDYRIVIEGVNGPHSYHVYEGNIWINK